MLKDSANPVFRCVIEIMDDGKENAGTTNKISEMMNFRRTGRTISFAALAWSLTGIATAELVRTENVCIDFGEKTEYNSSTGWNVQEGEKEGWGILVTGGDRVTTDLKDKATGNNSAIKVTFEHATGLNVGNSTPATGSSTLTAPSSEMQQIWKLMHDVSLTAEEINSYWTEVVVLGVGVSVGDVIVEGLQSNSTYAISAAVTSAQTLSLLGKAAPIDMKDSSDVNKIATFMTSNDGSVNLQLAVGDASIAGLISGETFTMTWIFETGSMGTSVDLSFGADLLSLGSGASISALAVTRYEDSANAVQASFEDGAYMLHDVEGVSVVPEPGTTTLSLLALTGLLAQRRRRR